MKEERNNNEGIIKLLCYVGIFVLLLFIVLPPLFRVVFPEEELNNNPGEEEKGTIYLNLLCVKKEDMFDYEIVTTINSDYVMKEGETAKISNSTITYKINFSDEIFNNDQVIIPEYEKLKKIDNVDFDFNKSLNTYTLKINYKDFNYNNEELLKNHQLEISEQVRYYSSEHFECNTSRK